MLGFHDFYDKKSIILNNINYCSIRLFLAMSDGHPYIADHHCWYHTGLLCYQVYSIECVSKMKLIISITYYALYGAVSFQFICSSRDDFTNVTMLQGNLCLLCTAVKCDNLMLPSWCDIFHLRIYDRVMDGSAYKSPSWYIPFFFQQSSQWMCNYRSQYLSLSKNADVVAI